MKQCPICKQKFETGIVFCPTDGEKLINLEGLELADPLIGELIDNKYIIEEKIASGGTGTVYRSKHVQLDMAVALKVMHPHLTLDKTAVERFRREAIAAMKVRHPNAIAVLDFAITPDGLVYTANEILYGMTLRDRITEQYNFSLVEANQVMQQICAALAVAHSHHIIHRDLKPDNIFLYDSPDGQMVKVLDFGIAKIKEVESQENGQRLTKQGFVLGTPYYMSPEQCADKPVDARSDVYSLGVVLYEMLTGRVPFSGRSYSAIVMKKNREQPKPTYEIRPDIPLLVDAVIMRAISKRPEDRPASISIFARELEIAVRMVTEAEFAQLFQLENDAGKITPDQYNTNRALLAKTFALAGGKLALDSLMSADANVKAAALAIINEALNDVTKGSSVAAETNSVVTKDLAATKPLAEVMAAVQKAANDPQNGITPAAPPSRGKLGEAAAKLAIADKIDKGNEIAGANVTKPIDPPVTVTVSVSDPDNRNSSFYYEELLQFTEDGPRLLRQEMQDLGQQMMTLLQIITGEITVEEPLDPVFFAELRATVDSLRAVMYHLHKYSLQTEANK
jgi:eukaryotic-like serine/threonine-protein kinase